MDSYRNMCVFDGDIFLKKKDKREFIAKLKDRMCAL